MISRFLMTACVLAAAGCGAVSEGREIDRASEEWELDVLRDGSFEPTIVRVAVAPGDTSIEYGGCECGSRPNPPRPKAEALGVLLLAAYFRQKRRAA